MNRKSLVLFIALIIMILENSFMSLAYDRNVELRLYKIADISGEPCEKYRDVLNEYITDMSKDESKVKAREIERYVEKDNIDCDAYAHCKGDRVFDFKDSNVKKGIYLFSYRSFDRRYRVCSDIIKIPYDFTDENHIIKGKMEEVNGGGGGSNSKEIYISKNDLDTDDDNDDVGIGYDEDDPEYKEINVPGAGKISVRTEDGSYIERYFVISILAMLLLMLNIKFKKEDTKT